MAYVDFLDDNNLIWEDGPDLDDPDALPRLKAQGSVVTVGFGGPGEAIEIRLKDGALDRVYGDGVNPDPFGLVANPVRPP